VGTPTPVSSGSASASDRSTPAPDPEHNPIRLAAAGEVTAGEATYTLVSAQLDQPGGTDVALRLVLRMTSHARFPVNFWSQSARLLVGQVPYAPTEAPNDVVEGNSAKEDTFAFRIPKTTRQVVLQVGEIGHENATLPIDLGATKP
jgi:hypothetical protein